VPEQTDRPITRETLGELLVHTGVPPGSYHLYGAHIDDALVIDHRPEGWVVFYSERGAEFDLRLHHSEDSACRDLLARLRRVPKL
jgi:hypothetical protein